MRKIIFILKLAVILTFMLIGCTESKLTHSGKYRINDLQGDTATFSGVRAKYLIPKQGLKKGLKIRLVATRDTSKVNVILIK